MPRIFVSLPVPTPVGSALVEWAHGLLAPPLTRWVPADSMHITLRFIGETDLVDDVISCALVTARAHAAHEIRTGSVGTFGPKERPSLAWIGVHDGGFASQVAGTLGQTLQGRGFCVEARRFHPHVTLARFAKTGPSFGSPHPGPPPLCWMATRLEVVESTLHPSGPAYRCIATAPFCAASPGGATDITPALDHNAPEE